MKTLTVNEFKRELKLNYNSDKWGEVINAHFDVCFEMHFQGFDIPSEWDFSPSPIGGDDQRESDSYYFDLFDGLSENDLTQIGNYLQRVEKFLEPKYSY